MAEKRTIFNEGTDPGDETVEDPVIEEGRKISELPPAPLDADGMATPELEDGEMAIAADVPPGTEGGKLTYKIKLSDVITNAKSEFEEYNVKNILAGTYIDDVTETPVDSGNWTINAEKQRMDPGTFVESLNEVKGDVTLTSTDESIVIEPEEVLNEETNELEYTGIIDLSLNTTTSSLYRAWVEVTLENIDSSTFDFEDEKLTKDNSVVSVNGVVLDGDQYNLTAGVVTILGVDEIPLKVGDVIGVISFVAETPNSLFQSPTYGLRTDNISIVGEDPAGTPQPKAVAQNNLQTQQDVNWYLLRTIENLDIPDEFDPAGLVTEDELEEAIEPLASRDWVDEQIAGISIPSIEGLASEEWVLDQSYITEQVVTDAVSDQAQTQETIDGAQDTKIATLENKVDALEGTVIEAKFKADARDEPSLGAFVLKTVSGESKTNLFKQAGSIVLSETDFENKSMSVENILNGDIVRLVMSSTNYATYKVTGAYERNGKITIEVEYGGSGSEEFVFDGAVYDFTHTTPFDVGSAATKQYVDAQDEVMLDAAKQYTDNSISAIPEPPEPDVDKKYVDDQDGVTLEAAKKYTDDSLGTIPEVSEPDVDKAYVDAELAKKVGNSGEQILPTSTWKIRARKTANDGNYSYIAIENDKLKLYHIADPTNEAHGLSLGYADGRYQFAQEPLVIKTSGSMECSLSNSPGSMKFCGLYNSSPGSSTNANEWFGNWNAGIRVNLDGMKTPEGEEFAPSQKYIFNGYVTIVGYENGRLYFKHAVDMIHRSGSDSYLSIHFTSRVATYATGKYDASDRYIVTLEGYVNKPVTTLSNADGDDA